ncbi:tRNA pseudouridylate synthase [Tieghemostelium lacteum]|uniref:tRNA pseudouridylate synthase n=1 Tax=Tieghemostelium lacteum TaxID=361077 RepID=A0A151ZF83_TIELA|nr:tRNA pseudouridylate synthase [Tieghemostelium lacteum]|eukprot:KYQ92631.1 tRNA pseudouridylate synthase [Tieghemostelium lacteum]
MENSLKRPLEETKDINDQDSKKLKLDTENIDESNQQTTITPKYDPLTREIVYDNDEDNGIEGGGDDDEDDNNNNNNNNNSNEDKVKKGGGPVRPEKLTREELVELQKNKLTTDDSKKKKVCVLLGYSGVRYCGMQKNPGLPTIEEELELAMFKAGGISIDNYYCQQKIDWMRCARTDKGVSAIRNIVSLNLLYGPPEPLEMMNAINGYLPEDIRIFDIKRVNNQFNSKNNVDQRSYTYITPTSILAPIFSQKKPHPPNTPFHFTTETRDFLNAILKNYVGTHKFHNYTSRKEPTDPSCKRRILSFTSSDAFEMEGVEMIEINVVGDSFMLHQIRKMIGCTMQFLRRGVLEDAESKEEALEQIRQYIDVTLSYKTMCLPMAPGAGLLLDKCSYLNWEKKFASAHGNLQFDDKLPLINEFKQKIFKEIALKEKDHNEFTNWTIKFLDEYPLNYKLLRELYLNPVPVPERKNPPKKKLDGQTRRFQKIEKFNQSRNNNKSNNNNNTNNQVENNNTSTVKAEEIKNETSENK